MKNVFSVILISLLFFSWGCENFAETASNTVLETSEDLRNKVSDAVTKTDTVYIEKAAAEKDCPTFTGVIAYKMKTLYIGVDNPIEVKSTVPANDLRISISGGGGSIQKTGSTQYSVNVSTPTNDCKINVSGPGLSYSEQFKVKRIPDPVARLGGRIMGGDIGNGEFKAQVGVAAVLNDFDFDAKCDIVGYDVVLISKGQDPKTEVNAGARYNEKAQTLIGQAKPGDVYLFQNIRAKCPGDLSSRSLGSMAFIIK